MDVSSEEVRFAGHGGDEIGGVHVAPVRADGPCSAIVLVHDVFGIDPHMRGLAERLAGAGFAVLLPDLYARTGRAGPEPTAKQPAPAWTADTMRAAAAGLPDRRALADLEAATTLLSARADVDSSGIAVVGFGLGGTLAFLLGCTSTRVSAVVDFYGRPLYPELSQNRPIQPLELALNLDCPLLAFFGANDADTPPADVERMRAALTAGAKTHEIVTYPAAGHGFFNESRSGHDEHAAKDAWRRTLSFLREVL